MRVDRYIQCPHCLFLVQVTGQGSQMVIKKESPPKTSPRRIQQEGEDPPLTNLKVILGDHFDPYWATAKLFGPTKNYSPIKSSTSYMAHISAGASEESIHKAALSLARSVSDKKYMPQFAKWLSEQDFINAPQETPNAGPSRMDARVRAE